MEVVKYRLVVVQRVITCEEMIFANLSTLCLLSINLYKTTVFGGFLSEWIHSYIKRTSESEAPKEADLKYV